MMEFSKKFVCEDMCYSTYEKNVPAPLFRKSIYLETEVDSAELLICGLGFYDLFVNGRKITKGYLAPYISNSDHITYFDRYDIRPYLNTGENVIGIMLGDGHQVGKTVIWNFKDNITNSAPMLALSAEITCGSTVIRFEADEFVCKKGPVIFNDLRSGVFYDARLEEEGWNRAGYDCSTWHSPIPAVRPRGYARICDAEPVKVLREIRPVHIAKGEMEPYVPSDQMTQFLQEITPFENGPDCTGGYIYDFGENNAGIYRLKIKGDRGQKVSIQCAEQLPDGKLNYSNINFFPDGFCQRDLYYLKGGQEEIFEPMFTFHGYRYIYVSGITPEQATEDLLTYLVMSSDLEERGTFCCSDEMANTIWQMGCRSDSSNFFYFPMDCPHREKNGWTGDASISAEHMIMTRGTERSWREWLNNIRMAQKENGQIPGIVPTDQWGYEGYSGPAWDSALFNLPYYIWKYRGETAVIEENAAAMLRYLDYISRRRDSRGLVEYGLGDWEPTGKGYCDYDAELGFTDSVMVLDMCRKGAQMFEAVGLTLHKRFAETLGEKMLEAIRQEYVDEDTLIVKRKCQSSQAMAIFYDVFREDEKQKAFEVLMEIIRQDQGSFTCGFLGLRVLFHVLAQYGEADLAYEMITKKEFPSYGYWVMRGETTFLEHFVEYGDYSPESKNHHFFGDVVNWFMSSCGGIQVQDAKYVIVHPHFVRQLTWCEASHKLPDGEITVRWERKEEGIELRIQCSGSLRYDVQLDSGYVCRESEAGRYWIEGGAE